MRKNFIILEFLSNALSFSKNSFAIKILSQMSIQCERIFWKAQCIGEKLENNEIFTHVAESILNTKREMCANVSPLAIKNDSAASKNSNFFSFLFVETKIRKQIFFKIGVKHAGYAL